MTKKKGFLNDEFMEKLQDKIMKISGPLIKLADVPFVQALQEAFAGMLPLIIVGSVFVLLGTFSTPGGVIEGVTILPFESMVDKFYLVYNMTIGIMALVVSVMLPGAYAQRLGVDVKTSTILGFITFLLLVVYDPSTAITATGSLGMFAAIVAAFFSVRVYKFCLDKGGVIKMPAGVPEPVTKSFALLVPFVICATSAWSINAIFNFDLNAFLSSVLTPLLNVADSFGSHMTYWVLVDVIGTTGIHSENLFAGITYPITMANTMANMEAYLAGVPGSDLPYVWTQYIERVCQAGMWPVLAILLMSKNKQMKQVAKVAFPCLCFNIWEPLMYGIPTVFNPILLLPMMVTNLLERAITYLSLSLGFVDKIHVVLPWVIPGFIGGPIATGDWRCLIVQAINFVVKFVILYPFFQVYFKVLDERAAKEAEATATIE